MNIYIYIYIILYLIHLLACVCVEREREREREMPYICPSIHPPYQTISKYTIYLAHIWWFIQSIMRICLPWLLMWETFVWAVKISKCKNSCNPYTHLYIVLWRSLYQYAFINRTRWWPYINQGKNKIDDKIANHLNTLLVCQ
jgi:hypothetical protein